MSTPSTPVTASAFRTAFAQVLIELQTAHSVRRSTIAQDLEGFGVDTKAAAGNTSGIEAVVAERDPFVSGDLKFADLNPDAQARLRARELQGLMRDAYRYLKRQTGRTWTVEEVRPHLTALGLPEPTVETSFYGAVYDAAGEDHYLEGRVRGELTQEQAEAKLAAVSKGSMARRLVMEAFGDDLIETSLQKVVSGVSVTDHTTWPEESEIKVEGAEDPTSE